MEKALPCASNDRTAGGRGSADGAGYRACMMAVNEGEDEFLQKWGGV
jgi:hypothetical protein